MDEYPLQHMGQVFVLWANTPTRNLGQVLARGRIVPIDEWISQVFVKSIRVLAGCEKLTVKERTLFNISTNQLINYVGSTNQQGTVVVSTENSHFCTPLPPPICMLF
ncbi:unnamed protein product [Laminaria digitata]